MNPTPPMRVWVTRTEPGATRLANTLATQGFEAFNAPVLEIATLRSRAPDGPFDVDVFVSEHAVSGAFENGWNGGAPMAIGRAAALALETRGHPPPWPPQADAEGVIRTLADSPPTRALLVKGEGGTRTLQRWLGSRGCMVREWDVYRRVPGGVGIAGEAIDAIVAASGDGLRVIRELWFAGGRDAAVPLLVPSARVAGIAAAAGFTQVVVTPGANDDAVVDGLVKLRNERQP